VATHSHKAPDEKLYLNEAANAVKIPAWIIGIIGLAAAAGLATVLEPGFGRFYHAYLISFGFVLAISVGSLFFVLVTHLVRAGWCTSFRRIPESLAAALPYLGVMALPIIVSVMSKDASLYPWAISLEGVKDEHALVEPAEHTGILLAAADEHAAAGEAAHDAAAHAGKDPHAPREAGYHAAFGYKDKGVLTQAKRPWLNPVFFSVRIVLYFVVLSAVALYFYRNSRRQDETHDPDISRKLSKSAPVAIILFALSVTFAVFDLLMSLDHHWYSTIFGVYFFAGAMIACLSTTIIVLNILQRTGYLTKSVTVEHYHDIGKFMFGFIVFWAYIAYSQYMLQWYANLPEITPWWLRRGASVGQDAPEVSVSFGVVSLILLFGHFVIPFCFLMSRHVKRNRDLLLLGAAWLLFFCWFDLYWLVAPELNNGTWYFPWVEIAAAVGVISIFVAIVAGIMARAPLRATHDPRLKEALAFHNI
jgi:hypothetical protein